MNKTRSANVEIARFVGAVVIMFHHIFMLRMENPFRGCSNYVEFFLIITGYYTTKHFDGKDHTNMMKESVRYTIKKFLPFLPYTIVATILEYFAVEIVDMVSGIRSVGGWILHFMKNIPFDIMFVTMSYSEMPYVGTLWYLSVLFIVLPLFAFALQRIGNRYSLLAISALVAMFLNPGVLKQENVFARVVSSLCMGVFVYEFTYIFEKYIKSFNRLFITLLEIVTFVTPLILIYKDRFDYRLALLCFMICLAIMIPGFSYTSGLKNKLFLYLGKLSMPLYIIHYLVAEIINLFNQKCRLENNILLIMYFLCSIAISMISMYLVEHWKWFQTILRKEIELRD